MRGGGGQACDGGVVMVGEGVGGCGAGRGIVP